MSCSGHCCGSSWALEKQRALDEHELALVVAGRQASAIVLAPLRMLRAALRDAGVVSQLPRCRSGSSRTLRVDGGLPARVNRLAKSPQPSFAPQKLRARSPHHHFAGRTRVTRFCPGFPEDAL